MNIAENFKFTKIEILYNRVTSMLSPFDTKVSDKFKKH